MLSAVLRSNVAIKVSIRIMNACVEMRRFLATNAVALDRVIQVELRQLELEKSVGERFERVFDYMESRELPKQRIFFGGQVHDAFEFLTTLIHRAKRDITLIDGYVNDITLNLLAKKADGVSVTIWTHPNTKLSERDIAVFNKQHPTLRMHGTTIFHDRFLIIDESEGYLIGASLKDAGRRCFAITRIESDAVMGEPLKACEKQADKP